MAKVFFYGLLCVFIWADFQIGTVLNINPNVEELGIAKVQISERLIYTSIIIAVMEFLENTIKLFKIGLEP